MTEENIKMHIDYIKGMNKFELKAFLRCAHKEHIYFTLPVLNSTLKTQIQKIRK